MSVDLFSLRDDAASILNLLSGFEGRVRMSRLIPTREEDAPRINVFIDNGRFAPPSGDKGTSGRPKFTVTADLSVVVILRGNSDGDLDTKLSTEGRRVIEAIMRNAAFIASIEGVTNITVDTNVPRVAGVVLGTIEIVFTLQYSEIFDPIIPDDFAVAHMTLDSGNDSPSVEARATLQTGD